LIENRIKKSTEEGFKYKDTDWYIDIKNENEKFINRVSRTTLIFGILISIFLLVYNVTFEDGKLFWNYSISSIIILIILGVTIKTKNINYKSNLIILTAIAGFVTTQILPGGKELDMLIFIIFPIIAIQIEGVKRGSVWVGIFWIVSLITTLVYRIDIWKNMIKTPLESNLFWSIAISIIVYLLIIYWEKQNENFFDKMVKKIIYDETTSLPNRKVLLSSISDLKESVVAIIKIENFNNLTSVFGYELSDNITIFAGESLKIGEKIYGYKTFHLKSDEFALYFDENRIEEEEMLKNMETLLKELHYGKMVWRYMDIRLSYRIGISVIGEGEKKSALSNADIALKAGRGSGSSINIFKSHGLEKKKAINAMLKFNELSENKENKTFKSVFQPIIDSKTEEIVWYEALMRIKNKNGEYETVYNYLEIAKTTGFYENITSFMLEEACKAVLKTGKNVSINISVNDILNKRFFDRIKSASEIIKNSTGKIILEILENEEIYEIEKCINFLESAKQLGFIIAIDDFGSGYSNFSNMITLPVDIIKIDGEIIKRIINDRGAYTIVEGILTFCKNSNKKSVAEFVESEEIFNKVKKLGVDFSQGYYIGKPEELI
jgi:EAL domain-containing protein (putative c-di-GMP-specific phosphodiesterase class I)/GGDEF domain-containing protein